MISIVIDKNGDIQKLKDSVKAASGLICAFTYPAGGVVHDAEPLAKASGKSYIPGEIMLFDSARLGDIRRRLADTLGLDVAIMLPSGAPAPDSLTISDYAVASEGASHLNDVDEVITIEPVQNEQTAPDTGLRAKIESAWSYKELEGFARQAAQSGQAQIAEEAYVKAFGRIFSFSDYSGLFDSIYMNMKDFKFAEPLIAELEKRAFTAAEKDEAASIKLKLGLLKPPGETSETDTTKDAALAIVHEQDSANSQPASAFLEIAKVLGHIADPESLTQSGAKSEIGISADTESKPGPTLESNMEQVTLPIDVATVVHTEERRDILADKTFEELRHIAAAVYEFEDDKDRAKAVFLVAANKAGGVQDYIVLAKTIAGSTADMEAVREILLKASGLARNADELLEIAGLAVSEFADTKWASEICGKAEKYASDPATNKRIAEFIIKNLQNI